ncbi:MAG: T9SS type A sorting domain-containing protein [Owenweeksia sp.]
MKKNINLLIVLAALLVCTQSVAQQTGSFNTQVTIMGQSRTLACYVPPNYDPNVSYRLMIGLHGLGDNGNAYRNALISVYDWPSVFPNTIFVFPDGGADANSDFYIPAGDEVILDSARHFAMSNYTIDSGFVVLQGFSLGGRSAIKYGLDHPAEFKGLLLNTPAFQGKSDWNNTPLVSLDFNYANASQVPIYLMVGDQDLLYYEIMKGAVKKLKRNNAVLNHIDVAGLGHTIPDSATMAAGFEFFQFPEIADFDVDIFDTEVPAHTCAANLAPGCYIRNRGSVPLTSVVIDYQFSGVSGSYTWTGNLGSYENSLVNLPLTATVNGKQTLQLSVGAVNGTETDTVTVNNVLHDTVEVDLIAEATPMTEDFESGAPGWVVDDQETIFEWYTDGDVKRNGDFSMGNFNTILFFYTRGNVESFTSPVLDFSQNTGTWLSFDVAYNYHKYTPPYVPSDTIFADTLEVEISTDCGQSWQSVYKKGGAELATTPDPILNPLNVNSIFFNPKDSTEWRTDSISLMNYDQQPSALIRFNYISDNGGSINLDNINVNGFRIGLNEVAQADFTIYPVPARERYTIAAGETDIQSFQMWDAKGNLIISDENGIKAGNKRNVEVSHLPAGLYQVEVSAKHGKGFKKILINP